MVRAGRKSAFIQGSGLFVAYGNDKRQEICECGNRMDRDVNAAVNIREEGKRIYKECA